MNKISFLYDICSNRLGISRWSYLSYKVCEFSSLLVRQRWTMISSGEILIDIMKVGIIGAQELSENQSSSMNQNPTLIWLWRTWSCDTWFLLSHTHTQIVSTLHLLPDCSSVSIAVQTDVYCWCLYDFSFTHS